MLHTGKSAVIAEWVRQLVDIFLDGIEREDGAPLVMHKKGAPDGLRLDGVLFGDRTFLKELANVLSEWPAGTDGAAREAECVEVEYLRPPLPLVARLEGWDRHDALLVSVVPLFPLPSSSLFPVHRRHPQRLTEKDGGC